jgi:DNA-binding NtrC family response regulator
MALKELLGPHGLVFEAESESSAQSLIADNFFDIALIDMEIDGPLSGIKILKQAKSKSIHSIILSSQNSESIIEEAYENGCDHFLAKSQYRSQLEPYIYKYKKQYLSNDISNFFNDKYITNDSDLKHKIQDLCKVNLKNKTVFITGETGVGKSLIGELLHQQTYDSSKPFIHINCSEISESLIESELFGHEKGSFTGATNKKIGKLELANGGTLFLDEIGTMPMSMQQKLLKALDQKIFYPVGSETPIQTEFTLITATCEDIFDKILKEKFRRDLFFRVSGHNLHIKPLRERKADIPLLIKHFLKSSHRRFIIKESATEELIKHSWPGNIRELKKKVDLLSSKEKGIIVKQDVTFTNELTTESAWLTGQQKTYIESNGLREFIKKIEEESLKNTLQKNGGKITQTIKELRISASAFYRIFEKLKVTQ